MQRCADTRDGEFLRRLTACDPSKVLITSRLTPHDLQDPDTGRLIPGVRWLYVDGLDRYDALDLMHDLGVAGDGAGLDAFMRQINYHSLLLDAIAGHIANYPPAPGDFDAWYGGEGVNLGLADLEPSERRGGSALPPWIFSAAPRWIPG